ncbi:MAG: 6-bladed beta-propeller, partial [Gemmatimonadales bacterium]
LEVAPDGRIFTLHPQNDEIRVHGRDGAFLTTIGRQGEGPGEFSSAGTIGLLGDTLWVLDYGTYRFSYFDLDGTLISSQRIPIDLGDTPDDRPPRPRGLLSDGTIIGSPPAWSHLVAIGEITEQVVVRMDSLGRPSDTVVTYSLANTTWEVTDPDSPSGLRSYTNQPFSDAEIVGPGETRPIIVRVERSAATAVVPSTFVVTKTTLTGDTVFSRSFEYTPIPISEVLVDSVVRVRAEQVSSSRLGSPPTAARAAELARASFYQPACHPPVSMLVLGRDGTIWLRREDAGAALVEWNVLAGNGDPLGTVLLPRGLRVLEAERGTVWGSEYDELDVPYIVRYRVVRAG